jgi:hypothetical protein
MEHHMRTTCAGLSLALLGVLPAAAQEPQGLLNRGEKLLMAYCVQGQGCRGHLADATFDDVEVVLPGIGNPKGAKAPILVFPRDKNGEWTYYVDTRHQLGELHRMFGGVGQPEIGLFPQALGGDIQPRDGRWTVTTGTPQAQGCLPGVASAVARQMPAMVGGELVFAKPFNGRQLIDNPKMTWVKTAPNAYAAALKPPNGKTAMVFRYEMRVAAPERIDGKALVIVSIPGMKTCRIDTPVSDRRT